MSPKKVISVLFQLFCALVLFFGTMDISEASWEGTIGTRFTVNGSGFGIKKPSVYVEYEKKPGTIKKVSVKVESYSDTSLTCLWTAKLPVGNYNLFVKPQIKGSTPVFIDTFSLMNPAIINVTPAIGSVGDVITIQGEFFSSKKPNIFLQDPTTLKRKGCKVLSFWMDPLTGESSLQFKILKGAFESYDVVLKNLIGETKMSRDFAQIMETAFTAQQKNNELSSHGDSNALQETVDWLREQTNVQDAAIGDDGTSIWIQYSNGIEGIIQTMTFSFSPLTESSDLKTHDVRKFTPESMKTSLTNMTTDGKKKAIILLPVNYNSDIANVSNEDAKVVKFYLEQAGYTVDKPKAGNEVTIDLMKTISEYDFVYMMTHGGVSSEKTGSKVHIMTGQKALWLPTVWQEGVRLFFPLDYKILGQPSPVAFFSLDPDFFDNYTYRNSFIFMFACNSYRNPTLANAFLNNGATVYMGWDNFTLAYLAEQYNPNFFRELSKPNKTLKEAYDSSLAQYFPGDVCKKTDTRMFFLSEIDKNNGKNCEDVDSYYFKNTLSLIYGKGILADQYRLNISDTTPPSVPFGLTATAVSSSSIKLTWNASTDIDGSGVVGYNIYRNGSLIGGSVVNNYLDPGLSPNTQYCYTVAAYDAASNVSGQSIQACAKTLPAPDAFSYICRALDYPGAENTIPSGINDAGMVVGIHCDSPCTNITHHGFLYSEGLFSTIDYPGAISTIALGINDAVMVVGRYFDEFGGGHGFVYSKDSFSTFDYLGAKYTEPNGINDTGAVVGCYQFDGYDSDSIIHGFLYSQGSFSTIDYPGGIQHLASGINNAGTVVGTYYDEHPSIHSYVYSDGTFSAINYPGAIRTAVTGINDAGMVVGVYNSGEFDHGFVYSDGTFSTIDYPGAIRTAVTGINDVGTVVGYYRFDEFPVYGMICEKQLPKTSTVTMETTETSGHIP
jgi:hypothetical protein